MDEIIRVRSYHDLFDYIDGNLYWKINVSRKMRKGSKAGGKNARGHVRVFCHGRRVYAHRIIWEMHNGPIPNGLEIDHIDGCRDNNLIDNLRIADRSQNSCNRKPLRLGSSRFKGVSFVAKRGKWRAAIKRHGKCHYLGEFNSELAAAEAYESMARELHGEYARTGKY